MAPIKVAILGSGNIGTDLMIKLLRGAPQLELVALAGIDPDSDGLARARRLGVATIADGLEGLRSRPDYAEIDIVLDATSARAHAAHAPVLAADGKLAIDLTPAAVGPYVVPAVNLDHHPGVPNLNMVTCGGQATIPIVHAIARIAPVPYAEIIASIASRSAGPGTRANIDEFTDTTSRAIESVGGAALGKAIIILNPADPPLIMRDTIHCLASTDDDAAISASIAQMVARVQTYVPGYRLKQEVQFERISHNAPIRLPGQDHPSTGLKVSVFLEVEGAAHYLPAYAGNLDIMTAAAMATAQHLATRKRVAA